jgi:hypothetical protein
VKEEACHYTQFRIWNNSDWTQKTKITNMVDVTKVKAILKRLNWVNIMNTVVIVSQLSGKPTEPFPRSSTTVHQDVCSGTTSVHQARLHPQETFSAILRFVQICELLEYDEYLDRFSLLKSEISFLVRTWFGRKFVTSWQYIPTIWCIYHDYGRISSWLVRWSRHRIGNDVKTVDVHVKLLKAWKIDKRARACACTSV